jgi:hypothetical protein
MTDFRALCAELLDDYGQCRYRSELHDRACAALAEQPVGPTDEELDELFTEIDQGGEALSWRAFARAVLARWGQP